MSKISSLELYIGKSKYLINCAESEFPKIRNLASKLNQRVNKLSLQMRDVDEKTILMLCAIMLEEEVDLANKTKSTISKEESELIAQEDNERVINNIENISFFIENLANKIKNQ